MAVIQSSFGACMVSRNIYEGKGKLKWCVREVSVREVDNGWRFLSDIDTSLIKHGPVDKLGNSPPMW